MNLDNVQLSEMCRICMKISQSLECLFDNSENGKTLADKLLFCTRISIEERMDRPTKICNRCTVELERAYEFHNLVRNSEAAYQELMLSTTNRIEIDEENVNLFKIFEVKLEENRCNRLRKPLSPSEVCDIDPIMGNKQAPISNITEQKDKKAYNSTSRNQLQKPIETTKHSKNVKPKEFQCYKCKEQFTSFSKTSFHLKQHDAEEKFKCIVCGSRFILWEEYSRHLCQGSSIQCSYCNETFFATAPLIDHLEHWHDVKTLFKCEKCGHFFSMLLLKQYHMVQHSNEGSKPFVCKVCGKGFGSRSSLRNHEDIHSDDRRMKFTHYSYY